VSAEPVDTSAFGRPIRGPSAFGGDARRFVHLTWTLAITEFKLRFFGSVLGYVWQLMRPLLLFGVLYAVFTEFVRLGNEVRFYPVILLANIMLYQFFAEATNGSVTSVVDRENLVRKIHFPRMVIPLSLILTSTFNLMLNLLIVFAFIFASGVSPTLDWLQLPLLIAMLLVLVVGLGMLLSALFVRFRDVKPIWEVVLQALFYSTPVIYVIDLLPREELKQLVALNPLAAILTQMRHALIDQSAPRATDVMGGWVYLSIPVGIVVAIFALGLWLFNREAPHIAEDL
jgi:ABC-2 type transport system permease protein